MNEKPHFAIRALEQKKIQLALEMNLWNSSPETIKEIKFEIAEIETGLEVLKKHLKTVPTFEEWLKQFNQTGWIYWKSLRVGYNIDTMQKLYEIDKNRDI